jgi:chromosome condensin MukBEF MukE localization factor
MALPDNSRKLEAVNMAVTDTTQMTDRQRAEENVRAIVEKLDRPTLALLYKTLHDALGFRIETADIAIAKLRG